MALRLLAATVTALLVAVGAAAPAPATATATAAPLPSRAGWVADVRQAMAGSRDYLGAQLEGVERPAVNFDIDNTAVASHYAYGTPTPYVFRFARYADAHGVALLFNTGRYQKDLGPAVRLLRRAGYDVTGICGRHVGETLAEGKQRCRQQFADQGWTLLANVGNRSTDFAGDDDYGRAFRLPSYGNGLA